MRRKASPYVIIVILVFGLTGYIYDHYHNTHPLPPSLSLANKTEGSSGDVTSLDKSKLPTHLKIPIINVDALLESVGLTPQGEMGAPTEPANAAWYNLGPLPGEIGDAVIDGHFGTWENGAQGIFNNLSNLHKGDKVYVEDGTGKTITFVVSEIRKFNAMADASDVFISNDGKSHLNLITCAGAWNNNQKSYPDRLVVFANKE